jgi:hypothetical protein
MDCMTFKDWIDIAQAVSVIAASIVAVFGINAWRKEFRGKRKIGLAEEVLELFYRAKDIITSERFPVYFTNEYSKREPKSTETPKQKQIRDLVHVTLERYYRHNETFSRIYTLRYRVMAQFDKNSITPFNELKSVLDDLRTELSRWAMLSEVDIDPSHWSTPQLLQQHLAKIEECEKVLWGMGENDPISPRLKKIIENIERICQLQITGKSDAM